MTKAEGGKPAQTELKAGHQGHHRRPQSVRASRLRQHAGLSRLDAALSDRRGLSRATSGQYSLWPPRHADLGGAGKGHPGDRRTGLRRRWRCCRRDLRRSPPRSFRCCESGDHVLVTDSVYGPTRTFCDTVLDALRRDDHLLRSADRRRHRRADAAEHPRRVHRDARLADLRDAGHPGDRRGRAPARRAGADGQHLGEPALFQGAGQRRRPVDPVRHQIHRRPFRPDARHGLRQQGDRAAAARTPFTRWACASAPTT